MIKKKSLFPWSLSVALFAFTGAARAHVTDAQLCKKSSQEAEASAKRAAEAARKDCKALPQDAKKQCEQSAEAAKKEAERTRKAAAEFCKLPCVVTTCSAPPPSSVCGNTTFGTTNCGAPCSKTNACVPDQGAGDL